MRVRLLIVLFIVAGPTAFAPAPFPRPRRDRERALDLQALQGTWVVEKAERTNNGTYTVVKDPVTHILVRNDLWGFMHGKGGHVNEYRIAVDARKKPVWFTFRARNQVAGGTDGLMRRLPEGRVQVLYSWGSPRPGNFKSPPSNYWALTLRREK
jgi:uncharacterized protein (TIGR03067 family)